MLPSAKWLLLIGITALEFSGKCKNLYSTKWVGTLIVCTCLVFGNAVLIPDKLITFMI